MPLIELRIFDLYGELLTTLVVVLTCLGEGETFWFVVVRLAIETLCLFNVRDGEGDDYFNAFSLYCFYPNVSKVFNNDSF